MSGRDTPSNAAPWYLPLGDEVSLFEAAYRARLPVLLEGPTGCGKTRFVEHMAWRLCAQRAQGSAPLITVACHEDLTATDLVGRYLLVDDQTVWSDGPLTRAVRHGSILYLDEIVEARKDTTVVIHALTDHRRLLTIEKTGEQLHAHPDFLLVISYNPGYQSVLKDLKPSTRQRFVTLAFDHPPLDAEARIVAHEGGVDAATARRLAELGRKLRQLDGRSLGGSVGTRLLVYAAQLIAQGIEPRRACEAAITHALGADSELSQAIGDLIDVIVP